MSPESTRVRNQLHSIVSHGQPVQHKVRTNSPVCCPCVFLSLFSYSEKIQRRAGITLHLSHAALLRLFVGTPAEQPCAVAEAAAGEVIVLHFDDEVRAERLPFAWSARCSSGWGRRERCPVKPGGWISCFELRRERAPSRRSVCRR